MERKRHGGGEGPLAQILNRRSLTSPIAKRQWVLREELSLSRFTGEDIEALAQ